MSKSIRPVILSLTLGLLVLTASGCVALMAAGAGAGTVAWFKGELSENVDASMAEGFEATKQGLKKMGLLIDFEDAGDRKSVVKSAYGDGRKITVVIEAFTEKSSTIRIRVGTFGDRPRSESILTAIKRYI